MNNAGEWLATAKRLLDYPLFTLGATPLTVWVLVYFAVLVFLLLYVSGRLQHWFVERLLARSTLQLGVRQSIGTIVRYAVVGIGFLIILQTLGIDLTTLNVVAGAVGIGVGFGLQNIAGNIVSGLIILFERPVKIGDRIQVGDVAGTVTEIRARSTTVLTNDNIAIIIPNSKIVSENVVNWSYTGENVRFRIPVGASYDSDVRQVERLLLEVARENPDVLKTPAPVVRLTRFGDSSLDFELLTWTTTLTHRKGALVSALNFAIFEKFKQHQVQIPYPQRDLHIRDGSVPVPTGGGVAP